MLTFGMSKNGQRCVLTVFVLTVAGTAHAQCPISLAARVNYAVGTEAFAVATGDFNGDGNVDMAVTRHVAGNNISVMLGNGAGAFAAGASFAGGNWPYHIATADLNGDGHLDLAVASADDNAVSILLGLGNGLFSPRVAYATGSDPLYVAIADLNGDSALDLAVANYQSPSVSILLGNGNGTFQPRVDYALQGLGARCVAIGDLDTDGQPDLAVSHAVGVSFLRGNGNGAFAGQVSWVFGTGPSWVGIADLSGDGLPDVVSSNMDGNNITVRLGQGNMTFGSITNIATGAFPYRAVIADFNNDGRLDLVTTNTSDDDASIFEGKGDGTFEARTDWVFGDEAYNIAAADVNNDGKLDLITPNNNGANVSVRLGDTASAAITQQPQHQSVEPGSNAALTVGANGAASYRWRHNGVPLVNGGPYSGVRTATLTITGATSAEAGVYDVQIGGNCDAGITSRAAVLNVGSIGSECPADFDADGFITGLDFDMYVQAFEIGCR